MNHQRESQQVNLNLKQLADKTINWLGSPDPWVRVRGPVPRRARQAGGRQAGRQAGREGGREAGRQAGRQPSGVFSPPSFPPPKGWGGNNVPPTSSDLGGGSNFGSPRGPVRKRTMMDVGRGLQPETQQQKPFCNLRFPTHCAMPGGCC